MLKNNFIQNHIQLINWLKNLVRFTIIGGKQFIIENYKQQHSIERKIGLMQILVRLQTTLRQYRLENWELKIKPS